MEGEGCLQTKTCPLDSGGYSLGLSGPVLTMPPWCKSTLYERCCILLGFGASITNICRAAGWATPNTFARFYNLRIEPSELDLLRIEPYVYTVCLYVPLAHTCVYYYLYKSTVYVLHILFYCIFYSFFSSYFYLYLYFLVLCYIFCTVH